MEVTKEERTTVGDVEVPGTLSNMCRRPVGLRDVELRPANDSKASKSRCTRFRKRLIHNQPMNRSSNLVIEFVFTSIPIGFSLH